VPHRIIQSWYTGRGWVGCYIWYSEERPGRAGPSRLLAVPNLTAHPSTASVPITVLLYGPLFCGFNVAIKELKQTTNSAVAKRLITWSYNGRICTRAQCLSCEITYVHCVPKNDTRIILNILYSCKSVAMKVGMWYPDDLSYWMHT